MSRVWFITGTSRGLGHAIAVAALKAGDSVIATARKPQELETLSEKYGNDKVLKLALDVSDNDQVIKAVKAGHEKFGRIDIVVNNAGYGQLDSVEDIDLKDFKAQIDANFYGVVYVTKAVVPILRQQGSGHIIQISSIGGRIGTAGLAAYQSAKWAVNGFSTAFAQEVEPFGIKVTSVEPGAMLTDWAGSSMKIGPISQPYEQSVGKIAGFFKALAGKGGSSPEKVADLIIELIKIKEPPLRLLAGADAVKVAKTASDTLAASDEQWRNLSNSTSDAVPNIEWTK